MVLPNTASLLFFLNGPNPASFWFIFVLFHNTRTNFTLNDKSIDGVLGSRTRGGMMEGADESTELWRHPYCLIFSSKRNLGSPQYLAIGYSAPSITIKVFQYCSPILILCGYPVGLVVLLFVHNSK